MLNQDSKMIIAGMTAREWLKRYHREYALDSGIPITPDKKPEGTIRILKRSIINSIVF